MTLNEVFDFQEYYILEKKIKYVIHNNRHFICLIDLNKILKISDIHSAVRDHCDFENHGVIKINAPYLSSSRDQVFISSDNLLKILFSGLIKKKFSSENLFVIFTSFSNMITSFKKKEAIELLKFIEVINSEDVTIEDIQEDAVNYKRNELVKEEKDLYKKGTFTPIVYFRNIMRLEIDPSEYDALKDLCAILYREISSDNWYPKPTFYSKNGLIFYCKNFYKNMIAIIKNGVLHYSFIKEGRYKSIVEKIGKVK